MFLYVQLVFFCFIQYFALYCIKNGFFIQYDVIYWIKKPFYFLNIPTLWLTPLLLSVRRM